MTSLEKLQRKPGSPLTETGGSKTALSLTLARSPGNGGHCLPLLEKEHPSQGQPGGTITRWVSLILSPQSEGTPVRGLRQSVLLWPEQRGSWPALEVSNLGLPRAYSQACGSACSHRPGPPAQELPGPGPTWLCKERTVLQRSLLCFRFRVWVPAA